ncbi:MAG: hypothetical protein KBG29_00270 [Pseudomonadales bacterium]|nr:hypothetical protein [Pseudomonadales bacterium]
MKEKAVQNAILREFGTRRDMRLWRANVGVARIGDSRRAGGRIVRFGLPGQADLTGILPNGVRLEIEVKGPDGQQTEEQRAYQRMVERFGGVYVLARSVQDVWQAIGSYLRDQG